MTAGDVNSPVFDFTSLDFDSVNADIVKFAQTRFPTAMWTDFNESNPGTFLIELLAYATDLLSYNLNASALEVVPATTIREQNFRNEAKSFDYTLKPATPSSTTLQFQLSSNAPDYPFVISPHLQLASATGYVFQPDSSTSITLAQLGQTVQVSATQGQESYNELLAISNGKPAQAYALANASLLDGTLIVAINGTVYTEVDNAVAAAPTDLVYLLSTDENAITTLTFGDGINGTIPSAGLQILATYKYGGGIATNLPIGSITTIDGTSDGSAIPNGLISVTNVVAATDGGDKQSLANAKANLPLTLKTNDRAITFEDFSSLAVSLVPGVLKANAVAGQNIGGTTSVLLLIVPNGGGAPSATLANLVINALKPKKLAGKRVVVGAPVYVTLVINAEVFVQSASVAAVVASRVLNTYLNEYSIESVNFAQSFNLQDAYDTVAPSVLSGVDHVFLRQFTILPYAARHVAIPTIGNGTAVGITTTTLVQRREWFVQFVNATGGFTCPCFMVTQRQLGTISDVTDNLLTDDSGQYNLNEAVGKYLHIRPQQVSTTFLITGNTSSTISVASGLLAIAAPGDPYVIEVAEVTLGKVLTVQPSAAVAIGSTTIPVANTTNWIVGDTIYVVDGVNSMFTVITAIVPNTSFTVATALVFPLTTTTSYLNCTWVADDGTVQFAVTSGSTAFVVGDSFYVDTFAQASDIILRDENFPLLDQTTVTLTTIGGVK